MDVNRLNRPLEDSEEIVFLPTFETQAGDPLHGAWVAADQADAAHDALAARHSRAA